MQTSSGSGEIDHMDITLSTQEEAYAVMIPSRCIHKSGCGNPRLTFDAYNAEDEKIFTKTIETTSTQGIEEGKKYPFALVF